MRERKGPRRTDIRKILIIGSGPIIIGQACEFDYSGSQACKALKEEGYEVVLVNSNPATIMTDPSMADRTYVEPITAQVVEKIIARERPDAILPTLGGQTGLNVAVFLARAGVYERYGVEVLGASPESISRAEDRDLFKTAMQEIGVGVPESGIVNQATLFGLAGNRVGRGRDLSAGGPDEQRHDGRGHAHTGPPRAGVCRGRHVGCRLGGPRATGPDLRAGPTRA